MAHNDFFQIKKQKIAGGLQVTAVADQNQNATEPALLPDEVARRAYFSYVNQGSVSGHDVQHWLEAEAQMFAENHIFPSPKPQGRDNIVSKSSDKRINSAAPSEDHCEGRMKPMQDSQKLFHICALL
jgi:hypothetical protein